MECVLLITDDDGMACVIATLIADYIFDAITEKVCGFALAFIAPLGSDDNDGWHLPNYIPSRAIRSKAFRSIQWRKVAHLSVKVSHDGFMTIGQDLLGGPPPTHIPSDGSDALFAAGKGADEVARAFPASPLPWAVLADEAWAQGRVLESYAFARTGYHRGLDLLRRNGWKGHGPVPWEHEGNRGWLRALHALGRAAGSIGESEEHDRCTLFLRDSSATAAEFLNK